MDLIRTFIVCLLLIDLGAKGDHCSSCTSQPTSKHHYDCSNCNFHNVPPFQRSSTGINLSNNKISTITNDSFRGLSSVYELNLDNNDLSMIETNSFLQMTSLRNLSLCNNRLSEFTLSSLRHLPALSYLDISKNKYSKYPDSIQLLANLKILKIDVFRGFHFDNRFLILSNLSYITFNPRGIFSLSNDTFKGLSNSPIQDVSLLFQRFVHGPLEIDFLSPFRFMKRLTLYMSHVFDIRDVMKVLYGLRHRNLDYMDISGNKRDTVRFQYLNEKDVENLKTICVKEIYLYQNNLYNFPFEAVLNTPFFYCLEKLDISLNNIFWSTPSVVGLLYFPTLKYLDVSTGTLEYQKKDHVGPNKLTVVSLHQVNVTVKSLPFLEFIDISGQDLGKGLLYPHNLIDFTLFFELPHLKTIKAANTNFSICNVENYFMTSLSSLDMSGWNCAQIKSSFLQKHKKLTNLNAANSGIGNYINRRNKESLFRGLYKLKYVDMSSNSIRSFSPNFFEHQRNSLEYLSLSKNHIEIIPESLIALSNIKLIDFSGNYFSHFEEKDRNLIDALRNTTFNFGENRFECSCQYIDSLMWMVYKDNIKNIRCKDGTNMTTFTKSLRRFQLQCLSKFWLDFSVILLLLIVITTLVAAMGYRNKSFVIYLYLKARRAIKQRNRETDGRTFQFDVFVSYSHFDVDWVTGQLFRILSRDLSLQVCVHHKDFVAGVPIAEEILRCIEISRKSVFVITRSFLASEWSLFEMDIARRHVFQSDSDTILVILKDEIPVHKMPNVLKKIWWRIVCLKYPQRDDPEELEMFWQKLSDIFRKE